MNSELSHRKLKSVLGLGFALVLLLIVALVWVGLSSMADIDQNLNQIVGENNMKMELAHGMMEALRERAVSMHKISVLADAIEQNIEFDNFNAYGNAFVATRDKFINLPLRPKEQDAVTRLRALTLLTRPPVAQAVQQAMKGQQSAAQELIEREVIPLQKQLASILVELVTMEQAASEEAAATAKAGYASARQLMSVLGGFAVILGITIAVVVIRHVTRQARLLQRQALFDGLTDLPNRLLFADRLHQTILIAQREKQSFALISVDLDRFKEINDTLGHHVGDQVLQQAATRMRGCLRESDTVARMGGDEYAILLPTATHSDGAILVAQKLLKALKAPLSIGNQRVDLDASLGIALFPEHGKDAGELQRRGDTAMYQAKRAQIGWAVYNTALDERDEQTLQVELRAALANHELVLHYQPKIDFGTNRVSGVEALVRWQHPQLGLLPPDRFIPIAEQSGIIRALTEYVLREALRQHKAWAQAGRDLPIAVNVSSVNIQDTHFPDQVAKLLEEFGTPPSRLELEITETAIMSEPARATACITKLDAIGVAVSIDDFGTGYSSLANLKGMLVAKIKIDRSFVRDMAINHNDAVIVRSTVDLGHNLGLKVVAEGVEDQAVWQKLKEVGCDSAQGYHMGRPMPPEKLLEWLQQSKWGSG
ncbi:MAG: EAL domain-containing protein [Sulfuricaulis sp.]|nr:EAL domain-containing protein [Sulfuricaulis sp.]